MRKNSHSPGRPALFARSSLCCPLPSGMRAMRAVADAATTPRLSAHQSENDAIWPEATASLTMRTGVTHCLGDKCVLGSASSKALQPGGTAMARQIILLALSTAIIATSPASAQPRSTAPAASCDEFLPARRQVGGKNIGPDECRIVSEEVVFNLKGQRFQRLELRIGGTVAGFAVKPGL